MPPQKKKQKSLSAVNKKIVKRRHNSYSIEQKRQVVTYAKENGIIRAANSFEIDKGMVSRWVKAKEKWLNETNQNSK